MSLKSAAFLAMVGTVLLTLMLLVGLVEDVSNNIAGLIPLMTVIKDLIFTFVALTLAIFFFAFPKGQS
jgi:hypothetical protein